MAGTIDILLSQRFLPERGGSIEWMHQVYRRWPGRVEVVTHDYYAAPPNTPECPGTFDRPGGRDHVTDDNLAMDRRDILMLNWGVERPSRLLRYARMTRAIHERLRRYRRDRLRVHCTHAVPEVAALVPLKMLYGRRLSIVCYAHGEEINACNSSRQLRLIMLRAHRAIDLMLCNSRYTQRRLDGLIDASRTHVVHPGVDVAAFAGAEDAGRAWRREHNLDDKLVVLTLGRMDPRKNHEAVLRAVAKLAPRHPGAVYVAAGQGRMMDKLVSLARELNVQDRVLFPGLVDGPTRLSMYGGCDVFTMPAVQDGADVEGFGLVFVEAGACGKPSVAGDAGGQGEAVLDGRTGLVIDGRDVDAVATALDRLLSDAPLRARMGQAARLRAAELDWPNVVRRTVDLVERVSTAGPVMPMKTT